MSWAGVVSVINGNCVYLNELGVNEATPFVEKKNHQIKPDQHSPWNVLK